METTEKRMVIYARYSCEKQTEQSIEGQLRVCHEFAERNGYIIVHEYIDRAVSGKTDKREQFQRMLQDSAKKEFDYVLVYKLDRFAIEQLDRIRALSTLTPQERKVYCLAVDDGLKQKDIAEELGVTQGAVSSTFRRARRKLDAYDLSKENTPDDIVWKLWQIFMRDFELPDFLDVEIEFVIRGLFNDLLPFINWFYSIGELCRYILRYYLFDEDKIDADIEKYLSDAPYIEQRHFKDYYGDQLPIIQGVYVRLCMEVKRREANKLQDSHKAVDGVYTAVEKIANRLGVSVEECFTQRLYPYLAAKRNRRLKEFQKYYSGKKLPKH